MKNVSKVFLKYWLYILGACLCLIGEGLCELQLPGYISDIITYGVAVSNLSAVKEYGLKMIVYTLGSISFAIAVGYFSSSVSSYIARDLREKVYTKTLQMETKDFNRFSTSSLINRCSNDVNQIQSFATTLLRTFMLIPIMGVGGVIKAIKYSGGIKQIENMIAIGIGVIIFVIIAAVLIVIPKVINMQKKVDEVNKISSNQLNGKLVIRALNKQEEEEKRFDNANTQLMKSTLFVNRIMAVMIPAMTTVMYVISILILIIIKNVVEDVSQIANMLAFIQYVLHIIMAFTMIAMVFILMPRSIVATNRIEEVLCVDIKKTNESNNNSISFPIVFDDVSYSYDNSQALDHVSFQINKGESVGIIGATGSGKTTLVKLIPAVLSLNGGDIYFGKNNQKDIDVDLLRKQVSFVSQKSYLFSGSIRSNVAYSNSTLSDDKVSEAIKAAQIDELLNDKEGLYKHVSQGGANISGGQKQRLSIARGIAKDAEIYIFDDAFSSLDYKTEKKVRQSIDEKLKDKTKIFISQRISSIKNLDKIIVLDKGRIVGIGNHKQLMESCSLYKQIAQSQFVEEV